MDSCSINPTDQVGFVNVLNFNTLGHLSLRPKVEVCQPPDELFPHLVWEQSGAGESWGGRGRGRRGRAGGDGVGLSGVGGCRYLMKS